MRPPRFIHVGTGGWGRRWSDTFLPYIVELGKAEPVAAVDVDPEHLEKAQRGYGIAPDRCYTDVNRAFAEHEADFAVIVVPPLFREESVGLALAHGCDILCEKPLAHSMEAAAHIYRQVRASGRKLAVTMSHRFDQDKQTLERLVRTEQFGPAHYIVGRLTYNMRAGYPWPSSHPDGTWEALIHGAAVHGFDIIRALSGSNARWVYTTGWTPPWSAWGGAAAALSVIELENGVRAVHELSMANASTLSPWDNEYWRVECRDGTLELDRRKLRVLRNTDPEATPEVTPISLDERRAWMNSWLVEMFVEWISGGPPVPTELEDNIHCMALAAAAVESAHTRRSVDVRECLERFLPEVSVVR